MCAKECRCAEHYLHYSWTISIEGYTIHWMTSDWEEGDKPANGIVRSLTASPGCVLQTCPSFSLSFALCVYYALTRPLAKVSTCKWTQIEQIAFYMMHACPIFCWHCWLLLSVSVWVCVCSDNRQMQQKQQQLKPISNEHQKTTCLHCVCVFLSMVVDLVNVYQKKGVCQWSVLVPPPPLLEAYVHIFFYQKNWKQSEKPKMSNLGRPQSIYINWKKLSFTQMIFCAA